MDTRTVHLTNETGFIKGKRPMLFHVKIPVVLKMHYFIILKRQRPEIFNGEKADDA